MDTLYNFNFFFMNPKMKHVDALPEHKAQIPHSTHDLSHGFVFTGTTAHLMPVLADWLNPDEQVDVSVPFNLITEPLLQFAQTEFTIHTEYFFVPIELLYQPFGDYYYNIKSRWSSLFNEDQKSDLPVLNLGHVTAEWAFQNREILSENSPECVGRRCARLFDMLDYPTKPIFNPQSVDLATTAYSTFPYGLLAYNCIYQYYYRLDTREKFRPSTFNVDKYYNQIMNIPDSQLEQMCQIKYRPLELDYYTDIKVSPLVDALNLNDKTAFQSANAWLTRNVTAAGTSVLTTNDGVATNNNSPSTSVQTVVGFNRPTSTGTSPLSVDVNTANLRSMFAMEKLLSITGRSRKHYDDQTLAHFGVQVPHDPKHEVTKFGHDVNKVQIGMVISTAHTADAPLGETAGKGSCQGGATHRRFTAPCHGVVMVIMSVVPKMYYRDYIAKYTVMRNKDDLFQPEYDHLGMQPLFGYEVGAPHVNDQDISVIGWQYRYQQWKQRFNKVSPAFYELASRNTWAISRQPNFGRITIDQPNTESYSTFLHRPNEANNIFVPQYSGAWSSAFDDTDNSSRIYEADPFTFNTHIMYYKRSAMSDFSLPRLD